MAEGSVAAGSMAEAASMVVVDPMAVAASTAADGDRRSFRAREVSQEAAGNGSLPAAFVLGAG